MTVSTFGPTAGDGFIDNHDAGSSWLNARNGTVGNFAPYTDARQRLCRALGTGNKNNGRGFMAFDTSALGGGATISAASIDMKADPDNTVDNADSVSLEAVQGAQASVTELAFSDYPLVPAYTTGALTSGGAKTFASITQGQVFTLTLDATGIGFINKTGPTKIAFVTSLDRSASAVEPTGTNQLWICYSEDPVPPSMSLTYTIGPDITSVTPASGGNDGVVSITNLAGTQLVGANPVVQLKDGVTVLATATNVVQVSASKVTCDLNLDGLTPGVYDIYYEDANGNDVLLDSFTVSDAVPGVKGIEPNRGAKGKVVPVTIFGVFDGTETAKLAKAGFGDIPVQGVSFIGRSQMRGFVDLGGGTYAARRNVVVTDGAAQTTTITDGFWVMPAGGGGRRGGKTKFSPGQRPNPRAGIQRAASLMEPGRG